MIEHIIPLESGDVSNGSRRKGKGFWPRVEWGRAVGTWWDLGLRERRGRFTRAAGWFAGTPRIIQSYYLSKGLDPFCLVTYYIKWTKSSWIYSIKDTNTLAWDTSRKKFIYYARPSI